MDFYKKLVEKLKTYIKSSEKKKLREICIIVIIFGVIILIAASSFPGKKDEENKGGAVIKDSDQEVYSMQAKMSMEEKLSDILSQISGAGKVNVMITYVSGEEIVLAYDTRNNSNETIEKDSQGGTRSTSQTDSESSIAYEDYSGGKRPVVIQEIKPIVKGGVVIAEGADRMSIREKLIKAVEVLLDVPIHKIQVFDRK